MRRNGGNILIDVYSLYSGSGGNAYVISEGSSRILIDAGKSSKKLCSALDAAGVSPESLSAVFITHEHSDHISALEVFSRRFSRTIHISECSANELGADSRINAVIHSHNEYRVRIGTLTVEAFPLPHDSMGNMGYRVTDSDGDSVALATDMGHVTSLCIRMLAGAGRVILESNHDVDMLKSGPYPWYLKKRIFAPTGHLSNIDAAGLAVFLANHGTNSITLTHLSRENNTPDKAFLETRKALDAAGMRHVRVGISLPEEIVEIK